MDIVRTASGKVFDTDFFGTMPRPKVLHCRILNKSFADVAIEFSNPENTKFIYYMDYVVGGCTLVAISNEGEAVRVSMDYETLTRGETT